MSSFYSYKEDPQLLAIYEAPSADFLRTLEAEAQNLKPIGFWAYGMHWLINGRGLPLKRRLPMAEALDLARTRISNDYAWANEKGWMAEIRITAHIERTFGLSVLLCMKQLDADEQGWIMLEHVFLKRPGDQCSLWSYSEE